VYLGFRPAFLIVKRTDNVDNWRMYDNARAPYNNLSNVLYPNLSDAEDASLDHFDLLANGAKLRSTNNNVNGGTYIYMAFAENPFRNALAR